MSTLPNLSAIRAMGSQLNTNVFEALTKKSLRSGNKLKAQANRQRPSSSVPVSHTPTAVPTPTAAMGQQMQAGRAARQARAANRNTPMNVTAQTTGTPHAPGVPAPSVNPISNPNAVAQGRANRQARSQTGQALAMVNNMRNINNAQTPAPSQPVAQAPTVRPGTGSRRASGPTVTGASSAPGTGRHRAGVTPPAAPVATPSTPSTPVVQSLQSRGQQVNTINQMPSGPKHAAPTPKLSGPVAPSTIIPSAPSALPKTTSGTTVGRSVHQQMQARIASTPQKVNTISNPPAVKQAPTTSGPAQFANTSTQSNAPFPTHVHPAGSSNQILPNLTAAHSQPGKPNQFTVGSRNIKGGGIASMGSKLEAGLAARPLTNPEKKRRV